MNGLPDVVPLLVYRDIERAHEFLVRAFGFEAGVLERAENGEVMHGEVNAGRQVIWLHRVVANDGWVSQESSPVSTGELVVRVDDVDRHCDRARAAGRRSSMSRRTSRTAFVNTVHETSKVGAGRSLPRSTDESLSSATAA